MGLFKTTFRFEHDGAPWRVVLRTPPSAADVRYEAVIERDGHVLHRARHEPALADSLDAWTTRFEAEGTAYAFTFGFKGLKDMLVATADGAPLYRSHEGGFAPSRRLGATFERADKLEAKTQARRSRSPDERLGPAITVDFALGVLFFVVGREFGLVAAALMGAGATVALMVANRFVRVDLLGGFAAFGAAMALLSAGLAVAFQDDLLIKLRGTFMSGLGLSFALVDAARGGRYLGVRLARYMEGFVRLAPRRAALAMAASTAAIMAIDLPLAFALTTEQWLWYNAVLDGFVAVPIVLTFVWLARERGEAATSPSADKAAG